MVPDVKGVVFNGNPANGEKMNIGSKEHYEILQMFEKNFNNLRLEKEDKCLWKKGIIYQNGETNNLYNAFILGYGFGKINQI